MGWSRWRTVRAGLLAAGLTVAGTVTAADDAQRAVSADAAWAPAWTAHGRAILAGAPSARRAGLVLFIGDSVTRFRENAMWPLLGRGHTASDQALIAWCHADTFDTQSDTDSASLNGWYLSTAAITDSRSFTAAGGVDSAGLLSGSGLPGSAMPAVAGAASAQAVLADAADYPQNLDLSTVLAAFPQAEIAVIEVGTNDVNTDRDPVAYAQNVQAIVVQVEAAGIVPILCTLPPRVDAFGEGLIEAYNQQLTQLAQAQSLPLIDFAAEILDRRPGASWQGTLIGPDGVHPSASGGGYDVFSDPYADGGDPASSTTGAACTWVGFLLRSWLIVQKLKQVKAAVVDVAEPAAGTAAAAPAPSGGGHHCGVAGASAALAALLLARGRCRRPADPGAHAPLPVAS